MKPLHFNITLIILVFLAYIVGARYPALAKLVHAA